MLNWSNYLAPTVNTSLDTKAILGADLLESKINHLHANTTMYHCYYDLEKRDTFVDYEGVMRPVFDTVYIDIDANTDKGEDPEWAWTDAKAICQMFKENNIDFTLYFSGNKGFHIGINKSVLGITEDTKENLQNFVKSFVFGLKEKYKQVDTRIWNANRKFRADRSQHEKSKLYKTRIFPGQNKVSTLSLEQIRNYAMKPPTYTMIHPKPGPRNEFLLKFVDLGRSIVNTTTYSGPKAGVKEVAVGTMVDDISLKYKNMKNKPCITGMMEANLPQFNRHDIGLRIIYDLRDTGVSLTDAQSKIESWAHQAYGSDLQRITDTLRMVQDAYTKNSEYRFGCYDEIRMAYCSAKCKIYKALDPAKRAQPLDVTAKQIKENQVKDNPNLELSEGELADQLLNQIGTICKASGEYFKWQGTHWELIDRERFEYLISEYSINAYGNQAPTKTITSLINQIKLKIPVAPNTNHFFTSSPNMFNFSDGTVIATKKPDGTLDLTLKPHSQNDYLGYVNQYPFAGDDKLPRTGHVEKYFESRMQDIGAEGTRMMKQMLGAAMIPYKPWIFLMVGESDSGKSTMALMIKSLLGEKNVSGVEPTKTTNSFQWEAAIGKIANIATELPANSPLDVNTLKKVRDKTLVHINRKGIKGVEATLPFLHIYCANIIPPSFEGNTGALDNRMSIIKFRKVYVNGMADIENLGQWLWDMDAGGVLDFAREGLKDLVESGFKYYRTESSLKHLTDWQDETDPVKQFVLEVEGGEVKMDIDVHSHKEGVADSFLGKDVWRKFVPWAEENKYYAGNKGKFYKDLDRLGVTTTRKLKDGIHIWWPKALEIKRLEPGTGATVDRGPAYMTQNTVPF